MARAKIGFLNLADTATVTASSQLLLAPVRNLLEPNVKRKWKSNTTDDYILVDLGSVMAFDAVALMGVVGNTNRFRYSTADATGASGDVWDSGIHATDPSYGQAIDLHGGPARYIRIDLNAPIANEAGRIVITLCHQFQTNFSYGWQRKWVDPSLITKTRGGQTQVSNMPTYRSIQATFNNIPVDELYGDIETMDRVNGLKKDVLFITDPASANLPRDTLWGLMTSLSSSSQPYYGRFSKQYSIDERL
jgi:hypothetical protein